MSDATLRQLLTENNLFNPPEAEHLSWSQLLLKQPGTGLLPEQVMLSEQLRIALAPLEALYSDHRPATPAAVTGLVATLEFILALEDHARGHALRDQEAVAALETLALKPEPAQDGLAGLIQAVLRLELSLRDFTRSDVRQALRQVLRAAQKGVKQGNGRTFLGQIHHWIH
jgi:hypothetical protein